ncbi:MAG: FMN-binding protein [Actinobacteria bacterium]|nr:FMN-binding protein [Actinomycetota bacterium]
MINFLKQSALVLILAVVFGSVLALIYANTNPLYEHNQKMAIKYAIQTTIPGAKDAAKLEVSEVELSDGGKAYQVSDGSKLLGWAYVAKGKGFGGDIRLLVGLNAQAKGLVGIDVLEDVETPGFGNSINKESWKSKFRTRNGVPLPLDKPLVVVKRTPKAGNPYQIQAITGATISSKAVVKIINETASEVARQVK